MIKIALLGSTGSIGVQTLNVVSRYADRFQIVSLAAGRNTRVFLEQVNKYRPMVAAAAAELSSEQKAALPKGTRVFCGEDAFLDAIIDEADVVVVALVGFIGIKAVHRAIEKRKKIALANKESLVVGGEAVMLAAEKADVEIAPIDSEHSAVWQALGYDRKKPFKKIILTASGGAFRERSADELKSMTAAEALCHPNWNMGAKITVDCATMINKGFEVIEAMRLYNAPLGKVEAVLHPQSIIHSMVEFEDNAVIAQLGCPSMELPIQLALTAPTRLESSAAALDFKKMSALTFGEIDRKKYPCYYLALKCAELGSNYPCALNAANEIAVAAFLAGKIKFTDIFAVNTYVVEHTVRAEVSELGALEAEDTKARQLAAAKIGELNG